MNDKPFNEQNYAADKSKIRKTKFSSKSERRYRKLNAVVDVRWPFMDIRGRDQGSESSVYTVKGDDSGEILLNVALMKAVA